MPQSRPLPRVSLPAFLPLTLTACLLAACTAPAAASGRPDPSFGMGGWAPVSDPGSELTAVAEVGGTPSDPLRLLGAGSSGGPVVEVRRFELDGSLDPSFGTFGVTSFLVPSASDAEVVKLLDVPFGSGYLVLIKATRALDQEGVLARILADGTLDAAWASGGFLELDAFGPHAVTDMEPCCEPGIVMISGQGASFIGDYEALVRFVDAPAGRTVRGHLWGESGTQEAAFGVARMSGLSYGALYAADLSPDTVGGYRNDYPGNNAWSDEIAAPGEARQPRAAAGAGSRFVGASWVAFGPAGRPTQLSAWRISGFQIEPDSNFGTGGQVTIPVAPNGLGYDALRPEEILSAPGGFLIAATQFGAPGGPLRRVQILAVDPDGRPLWEGPPLLGPSSDRDHEARDMVTLSDGRQLLAVTATERANPSSVRGWLLATQTPEILRDGFESGDLTAWGASVGGP
ncbi:MAG: hypothetical protein AAF725_14620 [Acidobacteriota bacterium]